MDIGYVALRDISITSDSLQPNWGFVVDDDPEDGIVTFDQMLHLQLDAIFDPRLGEDVPVHTETELCIGTVEFCGETGNGAGFMHPETGWFQIFAAGIIPEEELPFGHDIPFQVIIRGYASADQNTAAPGSDGELALGVWPNPSATSVAFAFATAAPARVEIFDVAGRHVASLQGSGRLEWDGRDATGQRAGAGVYLARYFYAGETGSAKVMMLR